MINLTKKSLIKNGVIVLMCSFLACSIVKNTRAVSLSSKNEENQEEEISFWNKYKNKVTKIGNSIINYPYGEKAKEFGNSIINYPYRNKTVEIKNYILSIFKSTNSTKETDENL